MNEATQKVIQWLQLNSAVEAELRKVAESEGEEYAEDLDYDLGQVIELVSQFLGPDLNGIGLDYLSSLGAARSVARSFGLDLEAMIGTDWVEAVEWDKVLNFLIKEA